MFHTFLGNYSFAFVHFVGVVSMAMYGFSLKINNYSLKAVLGVKLDATNNSEGTSGTLKKMGLPGYLMELCSLHPYIGGFTFLS